MEEYIYQEYLISRKKVAPFLCWDKIAYRLAIVFNFLNTLLVVIEDIEKEIIFKRLILFFFADKRENE